MRIPKCMSTQHPDNVNLPFFAKSPELQGEDEVQEAYYAFSHLGCDEQMWDCEGKEVDSYVVKKLLTKYDYYFKEKKLGKDVFLTLRVPNPQVEKAEAKILLETLESIPRSFDAAKLFYNEDIAPVFEVILPMATSCESIDRIHKYYRNFVVGKQDQFLKKGDIKICEWIGEFKPHEINVIPLFETMEHMLSADKITEAYLRDKETDHQRVFLARSDPALNYGNLGAVLINKIALQRLYALGDKLSVKIYPILGCGGAPFRGNLRPQRIDNVVKGYPSIHTLTIQSSFKYDHAPDEVTKAIKILRERKTQRPIVINETMALDIVYRYSEDYNKRVIELAPLINRIAKYVPKRRKRKMHVGLFGYSRDLGEVKLPRAITFTASLYSAGLPPEILGLNALNTKDLDFIKTVYVNFENDLRDALEYLNPDTGLVSKELLEKIKEVIPDYQSSEEHKKITSDIVKSVKLNNTEHLQEQILAAASIRQFLG